MTHDDWDLFAIVRSCKAATFTATTSTQNPPTTVTSTTTPASPNTSHENGSFSFPNLVQPPTNESQELHQLLINFNPTTTTTTISTTITSAIGINPNSTFSDVAGFIGQQHNHHLVPAPTNHTSIGAPSTTGFERFQHQHQHQHQHHHQQQHQSQTPEQQQQKQKQNLPQLQAPQTSPILSPTTQPQTPRSRKRKNHQKKIVRHVTADNLSADSWAWRKYGQKPIKGSPYPRNYYRCSSCKGCAARKQVERSTTEPNMFIVTYTGEHKHAKPVHRNSLAGSTRTKPSPTRLPEAHEAVSGIKTENACSSTSELSTTSLKSGTPENEETVAAGEPGFPEMEVDPDALSDNDYDLLIPNTGAMSDAVLLGLTHGAETKGSDPDSESGLTHSKSDPFSNTV